MERQYVLKNASIGREGGLRNIRASSQPSVFLRLVSAGSGVCMEEHANLKPFVPRNLPVVEVVDLEEDTVGGQEVFFQSLLQEGHDDHEFTSPPVDSVSEGTFGGWDTSLVEPNTDSRNDRPVLKRDYESLLMTARLSLMEDQQLKLPWETGVLRTFLDDDSESALLPAQVLSVPGDVLCGSLADASASSSVVPAVVVVSRYHITLPSHACAIKVLPDRDFVQELDVLWIHAVDMWLRIFEILGYAGLLGECLALKIGLPDGGKSREMVNDSMGIKSPRTAVKRAQTILKYFTWMQSAFDDWNPWLPARCIAFMSVGNSKGPVASRGTSLLEAFRF